MKNILTEIYPRLKKEIEQINLTIPDIQNSKSICFNLPLKENKNEIKITGKGEDFKNKSGIFFQPFDMTEILGDVVTGSICRRMEVIDIYKREELKISTTIEELENLTEEEWVEKRMHEVGNEIDRLCRRWIKKGKSKFLGITFPKNNTFQLIRTSSEIECELIGDTVLIFPIPTEFISLWLYHLVSLGNEDDLALVFFSSYAERKKNKNLGHGLLVNSLRFGTVPGQGPGMPHFIIPGTASTIGNYMQNGGVYVLPKIGNP